MPPFMVLGIVIISTVKLIDGSSAIIQSQNHEKMNIALKILHGRIWTCIPRSKSGALSLDYTQMNNIHICSWFCDQSMSINLCPLASNNIRINIGSIFWGEILAQSTDENRNDEGFFFSQWSFRCWRDRTCTCNPQNFWCLSFRPHANWASKMVKSSFHSQSLVYLFRSHLRDFE